MLSKIMFMVVVAGACNNVMMWSPDGYSISHSWFGSFQTFWQWVLLLSDYLAARCIAALMVIFAQLRERHLPQREDQAISSI